MSASIDTRLFFFASIMMGVLLLQRHNYCHVCDSGTRNQRENFAFSSGNQGTKSVWGAECVCVCLDIFAGKRIRNVIILLTRED